MAFDVLEADGWNPSADGPYTVCHRQGCHVRIPLKPAYGSLDPSYYRTSDACVVVQKNMQHPYCSVACLALEAVHQLANPS